MCGGDGDGPHETFWQVREPLNDLSAWHSKSACGVPPVQPASHLAVHLTWNSKLLPLQPVVWAGVGAGPHEILWQFSEPLYFPSAPHVKVAVCWPPVHPATQVAAQLPWNSWLQLPPAHCELAGALNWPHLTGAQSPLPV